MRQRDTDGGSSDLLKHTVTYEIYLKGREDPVRTNATFEFKKEMLTEGQELEDFMQVAVNHLLTTIDIVREHRYMLSDERFNKFIALTDEMQAVSILAPDEETLLKALED